MIKNKLKLSIVAAMVTATCGFAGTVTAPNSIDIELSGDIELKQVSEKTNTTKINKRTAEVNLALEAKLKNGAKIFTTFTAYDANQGDAAANTALSTKEAYAVVPIMGGKGKVVAGLAPNNQYGTEAFDNGGEDWKIAVNVPVAKGVKVTVVSKVKNEEEADKDKGDTGATAIRVDAKVGELMIGAKYAQGYKNKGDGFTGTQATTELKSKVLMAYVTGKVAGLDVGFEYANKDMTKVGATAAQQFKDEQTGYFLTAGKTMGNLTVGASYLNLSKGMKGGDDFAPGMILDANIDSSATKDTTAIVLPVEFAVNEQVTATAAYISADIQGKDGTEIDLGASYAMDDNIKLSVGYGKFDSDTGCVVGDQTNIEVAIAITF